MQLAKLVENKLPECPPPSLSWGWKIRLQIVQKRAIIVIHHSFQYWKKWICSSEWTCFEFVYAPTHVVLWSDCCNFESSDEEGEGQAENGMSWRQVSMKEGRKGRKRHNKSHKSILLENYDPVGILCYSQYRTLSFPCKFQAGYCISQSHYCNKPVHSRV